MRRSLFQTLGPGLLWAGTAIGVSHLVQSTRAGAGFGLALLWLVIAANVFKYPGFEAGPRYAAATGRSLLEGYRRLGMWAVVLFLALTVSTMLTVIAAVTLVTAGMAASLISADVPVWAWSGGLLALVALLLGVGRFKLLDGLMKVMVLLLTVSTLVTLAMLLPTADLSRLTTWPPIPSWDPTTLIFLCALAGWMPSALDTAVWQSLWGLEKARMEDRTWSMGEATLDFNIGYIGTATLAVVFVVLGALVLHGTGTPLPDSAAGFARTLVDVYAEGLGAWARPVIMIAAFATMLSTTLSVTDGFPRAIEGGLRRLRRPEAQAETRTPLYWGALGVCIIGAFAVIVVVTEGGFGSQFKLLIEVATILTGLTGTVFGVLNLLVLRGSEVPREHRPSPAFTAFHIAGIVFMTALAGVLLYALVAQGLAS
ncbi:MAG: NRAMP family divalent metal transporter [Myxococcota bacterium]